MRGDGAVGEDGADAVGDDGRVRPCRNRPCARRPPRRGPPAASRARTSRSRTGVVTPGDPRELGPQLLRGALGEQRGRRRQDAVQAAGGDAQGTDGVGGVDAGQRVLRQEPADVLREAGQDDGTGAVVDRHGVEAVLVVGAVEDRAQLRGAVGLLRAEGLPRVGDGVEQVAAAVDDLDLPLRPDLRGGVLGARARACTCRVVSRATTSPSASSRSRCRALVDSSRTGPSERPRAAAHVRRCSAAGAVRTARPSAWRTSCVRGPRPGSSSTHPRGAGLVRSAVWRRTETPAAASARSLVSQCVSSLVTSTSGRTSATPGSSPPRAPTRAPTPAPTRGWARGRCG